MTDIPGRLQVVDASVSTSQTSASKARSHRSKWSDISIIGLLQVVGLLPFIATFVGFAGSLYWIIDLLNHFRFQYLVILSVVAMLLAYLKHRKLASLYLIAIAVNLLTILPLYWPTFARVDPARPQLKLMHFNVHTGNKDYDAIANYISQSGCDLVFIQELHMRMDQRLRQMTDYNMVVSEPRYDSFGIGMLVRKGATNITIADAITRDITQGQAQVPAIITQLTWEGRPLALMSLHTLPPRSGLYARTRDRQLLAAADWVNKQSHPVILLGDLNATPWSSGFRKLFSTTMLHNSQQGFGIGASWPADGGPIGKIPIDHCLITDDFAVIDRHLEEGHGSDHLPLLVTLQLK